MSVIKDALGRVRAALIPRPKSFRVLLLGKGPQAWLPAVEPGAPAWSGVHAASSVRHIARSRAPGLLRFLGGTRDLFVPLLEADIIRTPRVGWGLLPRPRIVRILRNKVRFARHMARIGYGELVPRHYEAATDAAFPCVLKKARGAGSSGVTIVHSADDLSAAMAETRFAGQKVLLQELVPSDTDEVAYFVVAGGRIVWQLGYWFELGRVGVIRLPSHRSPLTQFQYRPEEIAFFERFFAALRYTGPVNIDIKRRADGSMVILEINPRLGGSLMRPENVDDLRGALNAIAAHAQWRGSGLLAPLLKRRRRARSRPVDGPIGIPAE